MKELDTANYIAGEWCSSADLCPNVNPSDISDIVNHMPHAAVADLDEAIDAAHGAAGPWGRSTPQQRFEVLDGVGNELLTRAAEIGDLLAREEGKTRPEAIGETVRAAQIFKFFAGEALRQTGDRVASVRPGIEIEVTREPLGVVGLITPWNFPIAIPAWKTAPALAFGNTVVLKSAELSPGCAYAMAEILSRSGLPDGAFNLVSGRGTELGPRMIENEKVAGISFTGSVPVGRGIAAACGANLKKVQLEMGGKNPLVVLDDADLEVAVQAAIQGAFYSTGQRCTASSRLIVTSGIHDTFVAALAKAVAKLVVGDARAEQTQIGPVIEEKQLRKNLMYVDVAQKEGGELLCGGERLQRDREGWYMSPALIANTKNDQRINREEVFGPVASVIEAADFDEALALANDTEFGLSAGVCTTSLKHAAAFKAGSQAGMVMVNLPTAGVDYHVPFGGRKGSSYGSREQGRYAAEFYTVVKTAYTLP
jgi:aldehyde dehydrogenase (NAD+)